MAYAYTVEVPIPWSVYEQIRAELGWEPPPGLITHLVIETREGLRYLDVWESKQDCDRFFRERVHPAVDRVFARVGRSREQTGEPNPTLIQVKEVWAPKQLRDGRSTEGGRSGEKI
jgi:hypothetical protein